eukprot:2102894-Ditylum_brightwellii.AAC.1
MSVMGRSFKMIEESGRFANMTGFANDLVKNNVPIGSGLTCCANKSNGFQFLLGLHEAPYLENNEGSLLSTNQSCEAGIWLADVFCCHGGDQRLVAPVKNSEEMLDIYLKMKDGLLDIECSYPSDNDWHNLPRVWLTGNEVPWDPTILDGESDVIVPLCWDGESEFDEANNNDMQEQYERNQFEDCILQTQKAAKFSVHTLCMTPVEMLSTKLVPMLWRRLLQPLLPSRSTIMKSSGCCWDGYHWKL